MHQGSIQFLINRLCPMASKIANFVRHCLRASIIWAFWKKRHAQSALSFKTLFVYICKLFFDLNITENRINFMLYLCLNAQTNRWQNKGFKWNTVYTPHTRLSMESRKKNQFWKHFSEIILIICVNIRRFQSFLENVRKKSIYLVREAAKKRYLFNINANKEGGGW